MSRRRTVVLDLSWIRSLRATDTLRLPSGSTYLIPDGLFGEIGGSNTPQSLAKRIAGLLQTNQHLFVGRMWKDVADDENRAARPASFRQVVNTDATRSLRQSIQDNGVGVWQLNMATAQSMSSYQNNEASRAELMKFVDGFAEWMTQRDADWINSLGNVETRRAWIQAASLITVACGHWFPEYAAPDWQDRLTCFPDQYAVGRWVRFIAWVALRRAMGATKGIENHWDDAQYFFLASYSSAIVTRDRVLREAVYHLAPGVEVLDNP